MIKLPPRPAAPPDFETPEMRKMIRDTQTFYETNASLRRQQKFEFPLFPQPQYDNTMQALTDYSQGKCAYCESPIEHPGNATLERFRPKAGALDKDGTFSTEHYWWLAYEWRNIYPACAFCNKIKGSKFPMSGRRCATKTPFESLTSEPRLLVDPAVDDPREHLAYTRDGTVRPRSEKGEATIATFELNRSELRTARQRVAEHALSLLYEVDTVSVLKTFVAGAPGKAISEADTETLEEQSLRALGFLSKPNEPWTAIVSCMIEQRIAQLEPPTFGNANASIGGSINAPPKAIFKKKPGPSAPVKTSAPLASLHSQIIKRIEVKNFRGVADLDLPIDVSVGLSAPWTVMLGENGAGKSSILQGLALTLLPNNATVAGVSPKQVLRQGTSSGHVKVWFHGSDTPRKMIFRRGGRRFIRSGPEYTGTLLGYGATRLLPRKRTQVDRSGVRLANMFDPFAPLIDAEHWLGTLEKKPFDFVARALREVLDTKRTATLRRVRSNRRAAVRLKQYGADLSLEALSDGYQSVLGLTCDIIAGLRAIQPGALDASEAIVIIDEIGAHLHPRWRMRIIENMRRAFKRVQFIASTHDPLCMRGLEDGEAVVLRRTSRGRVYVVPDLPPIKGLRVDQLLTSEFFGLDSTIDPSVEAKFRELYRLLAVRKPTKKMETEIEQLRTELAPYEIPGATRRERRLLEVIDRELAQLDVTPDLADRAQIRSENEEIMQRVLNPVSKGNAS